MTYEKREDVRLPGADWVGKTGGHSSKIFTSTMEGELSGSGLALLGITNTLSHYQAMSEDIV